MLITSLNPGWPPGFETQQIESFTREESLHLLQTGLPGTELDALDRLAERLGDHPLMLTTAVAELSSYPAHTDNYIALIERRESDVPGEVPEQYRTLDAVYRVVYEGLHEQHPAAVAAINEWL